MVRGTLVDRHPLLPIQGTRGSVEDAGGVLQGKDEAEGGKEEQIEQRSDSEGEKERGKRQKTLGHDNLTRIVVPEEGFSRQGRIPLPLPPPAGRAAVR